EHPVRPPLAKQPVQDGSIVGKLGVEVVERVAGLRSSGLPGIVPIHLRHWYLPLVPRLLPEGYCRQGDSSQKVSGKTGAAPKNVVGTIPLTHVRVSATLRA